MKMNKQIFFLHAIIWTLVCLLVYTSRSHAEETAGWPGYDHSSQEAVERDCEAKEWFEACLKQCKLDDRCIDQICTTVEFNNKYRDWNCLKRHSLDWIDDKSYLQKDAEGK
jgi:hypothetical protein